MKIGKVIGKLWATRKAEHLSGEKFLIVKVLEHDEIFKNEYLVACDRIGAGNGDLVLLTQSSNARKIGDDNMPIDCAVIGIIDSMEF